MRISIRCAKVKILMSDSGDDGIVVVLDEVNEEDLMAANSMVCKRKLFDIEEIDELKFPEELGL